MEEVLNVLNSILNVESDHLHVYIEALEECLSFQQSNVDVTQIITLLLSKSKSRILGFHLLLKYLDQCAIQALEQKASLWMTLTLKACNDKEMVSYADVIYETLRKLADKMRMTPDLSKSFTNNFIGKIYESLLNASGASNYSALRCLKLCLCFYAGPSGLHRTQIERFLTKFVDSSDEECVEESAKCWVLMQQVRGGGERGINYKMQWKNYQLKLLGSLHALLDEAFSKCINTYDGPIVSEQLNIQRLPDDDEPAQRTARLVIRFCNLVEYLQYALCESFPVEKPIFPLKILNIIQRGLETTLSTLKGNPISENLTLGVLLPKIHTKLLELLETLIIVLGSHLRQYHQSILGFLLDTLKWTSSNNTNGVGKSFINLRTTAYRVLKLWCSSLSGGSLVESIAERLFKEVINDITPVQPEITLKVHNTGGKYISKKARRQLHKSNNEQTMFSQQHSHKGSINQQNYSDEGNKILCQAALSCLQQVLISAGHCIRPTLLKVMQTKILEFCAVFYDLPLKKEQMYSSWECRLEIYNCLYALTKSPHHLCPPPIDMAIAILQNAQTNDCDSTVRQNCLLMMGSLEKCLHPQKQSLFFPVETKNIEIALAKPGQEELLNEDCILDAQSDEIAEDELVLNDKVVETVNEPAGNVAICETEQSYKNINESAENELDCLAELSSDAREQSLEPPKKLPRLDDFVHVSSPSVFQPDKKNQQRPDSSYENSETNIDDSSGTKKYMEEAKSKPLTKSSEDEILLSQDDDKLIADLEAAFVDELN